MHLAPKSEGGRAGKQILLDLVRPFKWWVMLMSLVSLAAALFEAVFILLLTGIGMTLVSGAAQVEAVMGLTLSIPTSLGAAGLSLVLRVLLSLFGVKIAAALSARITVGQRQRLSSAYLQAEWSVQHQEPAGRLQELLTTFVRRMTDSVTTLTVALSAGLSLLAFLATGIAVDPLSAAAVLLALAVVSAVLVPLRRAIRRRSQRNADAGMDFATAVSEFGSLGLEMQVFGARPAFEQNINTLNLTQSETQRQTDVLRGALPQVYMSLAYGAILVAVALLTKFESINIATVGAIMLLMIRAISYGQQLATASGNLATSIPFLEKVERAVGHYHHRRRVGGLQKPDGALPIQVADVSFHYPEGDVVLRDIDVVLLPGETVGVIGPSGAGKSTLAQLLLGLRLPTSGNVLVGGAPTHDIDPSWWVDKTTFVPQDAKLLTGTVADNIRFFREGITDEEIRTATELANVRDEIEAMPDGIETHLGQRGGQLSGGQRQRISIARGLVRKPEFLVLDEPTSALDGESETLVRDTLEALRGEITVLIIAHRMSTLDFCDRIMVIEEGRVTAFDTPERLRTTSDFYRKAMTTAGLF